MRDTYIGKTRYQVFYLVFRDYFRFTICLIIASFVIRYMILLKPFPEVLKQMAEYFLVFTSLNVTCAAYYTSGYFRGKEDTTKLY